MDPAPEPDKRVMDTSHTVITDSHAHGIARYFLSTRTSASAESICRAREAFDDAGIPATRKGVRRLFAAIHHHLDRRAWIQESWTDRHESRGVWLIAMFDREELAVVRVTVTSHRKSLTTWTVRKVLGVPLHAIARGHQRIHDTEWAAVEEELKLCALFARAVHGVSGRLSLRQFGIPAFSGLLVGNVEADHLQAKTFVTPPFSSRHQTLLDAWMRFSLYGPGSDLDLFTALTMERRHPGTRTMLEQLESELADPKLTFLASTHESGIDHAGVMWEMARAQAAANS